MIIKCDELDKFLIVSALDFTKRKLLKRTRRYYKIGKRSESKDLYYEALEQQAYFMDKLILKIEKD